MTESFNPYREWLGLYSVPAQPSHYQLLGLRDFEADFATIMAAAEAALVRVRAIHPGPRVADWARLLDEITNARNCLCQPAEKARYDAQWATRAAQPQPATADFYPPGHAPAESSLPNAPPVPGFSVPAFAPGFPAPTTIPGTANYGWPAGMPSYPAPAAAYGAYPAPMTAAPSADIPGANAAWPSYANAPVPNAYAAPSYPTAESSSGYGTGYAAPSYTAPSYSAPGYAAPGYAEQNYAAPTYVATGYEASPAVDSPAPVASRRSSAQAASLRARKASSSMAVAALGGMFLLSIIVVIVALLHGAGDDEQVTAQNVPPRPVSRPSPTVSPPSKPVATPNVGVSRPVTPAPRPPRTAGNGGTTAIPVSTSTPSTPLPNGGFTTAGPVFGPSTLPSTPETTVRPVTPTSATTAPPTTPSNPTPTPTPAPAPATSAPNPDPFANPPSAPTNPPTPATPPTVTPSPATPNPDPFASPPPSSPRPGSPPPSATPPSPTPNPDPFASPPPGTEPKPTTPSPAPPSNAPTSAPVDTAKAFSAVREALSQGRVSAAEAELAKLASLTSSEDLQRVEAYRELIDYVRQFQRAFDEAYSKLDATNVINVGGSSVQVSVVEATPTQIVVRAAGSNRTYPRNGMPVGLAVAIADTWFDQNAATTKAIKAVYVLVHRDATDPQKQKARGWLDEAAGAGVDLKNVRPLLEAK